MIDTESIHTMDDAQMRESLALLHMLSESAADIEAGHVRDSDAVFADLRRMLVEKGKASAQRN